MRLAYRRRIIFLGVGATSRLHPYITKLSKKSQAPVQKRRIEVTTEGQETTVKDQVYSLIAESDKALGPKEIAEAVGTTENTVSQYLRELKKEGKVTKKGRGKWILNKNHTSTADPNTQHDDLVEKHGIPPQAAIVIRHAETDKIWVTVEMTFRVHVHEPINLTGGQPPPAGGEQGKGDTG